MTYGKPVRTSQRKDLGLMAHAPVGEMRIYGPLGRGQVIQQSLHSKPFGARVLQKASFLILVS